MPNDVHQNSRMLQAKEALTSASKFAEDYLEHVADRPVAAPDAALDALIQFDITLPETSSTPQATIELLHNIGSPATTATAGGRFFGLVVGGTLPAALGARVIASSWDQVVLNNATSPIGVKLEQIASRWLLDIFGLPEQASVGFTTGASVANFTCLAAARHALLARAGWDVEKQGLNGAPKLRVVASEEIHIIVLKALSLLGFGHNDVERVRCDHNGAIDLSALPELDSKTLVLTQAGNVNSGACDPIAAIATKAAKVNAWVHVDGAFGLWAAASPRTRVQLSGYETADSWVVDGHKWLNTPYDCGIAICKHPAAIHAPMATQAPYLKEGSIAAPKDMVPEFSRSARGVEVWAALHSLGRTGVADLVDRCCAHARAFADGLRTLGFDILNDVRLNQVVATLPEHEHLAPQIAEHVQRSGEAWFGSTEWQGRQAIRISVSSWVTSKADVQLTLAAIRKAVDSLKN